MLCRIVDDILFRNEFGKLRNAQRSEYNKLRSAAPARKNSFADVLKMVPARARRNGIVRAESHGKWKTCGVG